MKYHFNWLKQYCLHEIFIIFFILACYNGSLHAKRMYKQRCFPDSKNLCKHYQWMWVSRPEIFFLLEFHFLKTLCNQLRFFAAAATLRCREILPSLSVLRSLFYFFYLHTVSSSMHFFCVIFCLPLGLFVVLLLSRFAFFAGVLSFILHKCPTMLVFFFWLSLSISWS